MIDRLLPVIGSWYGNQRDYLVCSKCRREYDTYYDGHAPGCPACGGEVHVVMPNGDMLQIRWRAWKSKQKWWPQKMHALPVSGEPSYSYWQWLGREWRKREHQGGLFG